MPHLCEQPWRPLEQRLKHTWKGNRVLYFRFAEKTMTSQINEAYLNILIVDNNANGLDNSSSSTEPAVEYGPSDAVTVNVQVSRVGRLVGSARQAVTLGMDAVALTAKQLKAGSWLKINVSRGVTEWFDLARENLGLIVRAQISENSKRLLLPDPNGAAPFLEIYTSSASHHRRKRSIGLNCEENSPETRCCRFPLPVDFEEFGWDWIIAPKRYEANYCSGDCPYAFFLKYPHTHIVHLAAPKGSHGPCCAPRKMAPISMLYFDHELNIIYSTLPGMVVERCGCS